MGALDYIAHVFYTTISLHAFIFYLVLCEGIWVQPSANLECQLYN